jgi:hypothetical protein
MADTLNPDSVTDTLKSMQTTIAEGTIDQLRNLTKFQQERAGRQAAIADRLAAKLGDEHERVRALRQTGESARQFALHFRRAISRIEAARDVRPGSLLFSGRVLDAAGSPLPGTKVRLSDRTGTLKLAGSAMTNELGEFTLVVPPDQFDPNATDLAVVVEDDQGRIAGISTGPLRLQPDIWHRVELTAAAPPRPQPDAGGGRRRAPDRRRSPRSPGRQ